MPDMLPVVVCLSGETGEMYCCSNEFNRVDLPEWKVIRFH